MRREVERALVVRDRLLRLAFILNRYSEIDVRLRVIGLELDRAAMGGLGFRELPLFLQGNAKDLPGARRLGLEFQRQARMRRRRRVILEFVKDAGQTEVRLQIVWFDGDGAAKPSSRLRQFSLLAQEPTQAVLG